MSENKKKTILFNALLRLLMVIRKTRANYTETIAVSPGQTGRSNMQNRTLNTVCHTGQTGRSMQNRTLNTQIVDEELVAIEQQRTRQLIKRLEAAQGNGTSVITLTLSCF